MNLERIQEFLKNSGVFYLATMDNDQPRVRPFGIAEIINDRLYVITGLKKEVAKQMLANPKVEICAMKNDEWIRISGEVEHDDNVESEKEMLNRHEELSGMYQPGDGNTAVFYFKNGQATISSFTKEPEIIKF